ncbi:MAG TPA: T9SS type A sorting domain-containing protein [Flavipsychrobacter sp.]|nr:T9SS type A sorting domain-containing protein [Flavipsychrobacter sp.]
MKKLFFAGDPLDGMLYDTTVKFIFRNNVPCGVSVTVTTAGVGRDNVKLYPNPAFSTINIEAPQNGYKLLLINILGQNILTKPTCGENETLDISYLLPGLYYMQLETKEGQLITKKLLIER